MNRVTRLDYSSRLLSVSKGIRLSGYSRDTLSVINLCAQFVRQTVESIEKITPGTWEVASMALVVARERDRPGNRYSIDYEQGAIRLGLQKKFQDIKTGDIGYWGVPAKYGHTAIAVEIDGKMFWLENIDKQFRPNSRTVYTSVTNENDFKVVGRIMLTPLNMLPVPRTLINPTKGIRDQQEITVPIVAPNTDLLKDRVGSRVFIIKNGAQQEVGTLDKATGVTDKVYLRLKSDVQR